MSNIVVNSEFTVGLLPSLASWIRQTLPGSTITATSIDTYEGPGSALLTLTTSFPLTPGTLSQNLKAIRGEIYELSYFAKSVVNGAKMTVSVKDSNGGECLLASIILNSVGSAFNGYTKYAHFFTATTSKLVLAFSPNGLPIDNLVRLDMITAVGQNIALGGTTPVKAIQLNNKVPVDIPVKDIIPGVHSVFNDIDKKFVPVVENLVDGPNSKFIVLQQDSIGFNVPNTNIILLSDQKLKVENQIIIAQEVPGGKILDAPNELVYNLVVDRATILLAANTPIVAKTV